MGGKSSEVNSEMHAPKDKEYSLSMCADYINVVLYLLEYTWSWFFSQINKTSLYFGGMTN